MRPDPKLPRPIKPTTADDDDRVIADEDEPSAYEPTYRDGSVRHECAPNDDW